VLDFISAALFRQESSRQESSRRERNRPNATSRKEHAHERA
jgi:hypothetical protein